MDKGQPQNPRTRPQSFAHSADSDDEAELLRSQNEFMSDQQRPAAKATRVGRQASPSVPAASEQKPSEEHPVQQQSSKHADDFSGLLPGMLGILTDVQEKPVSGHISAPSAPAGGSAFPKATHRKLSKFALSRQQPKAPQASSLNPSPNPSPGPSLAPALTPKLSASSSLEAGSRQGNQPTGSAATTCGQTPASSLASESTTYDRSVAGSASDGGGVGLDVGPGDQRRIDAENRQLLNSMSPAEVEEARQELMSRLSPSAQAFLAKRAAAKRRSNGPTTAGGPPATAGDQPGTVKGDSTTAAFQATTSGQAGHPTPSSKAYAAASAADTAGQAGKAGKAGKAGTAHASIAQSRHASSAERDTGSNSDSIQPNGDVVSRLRFSLEGQVVGLKATSDTGGPGADQQVVQRDILRQDEGSSPEGYTLQEACTLTRSSLTKQRVLAVRILAAVMAAARPQARHHDAAGVLLPQHVTFPSHALWNANQDVGNITWLAVWEYALQEMQVATVLRLLLDDAHTPVVTAAAEAMAVLVGPSPEEEDVWEAADCNPVTGCSAMPWRYFARPHPVGAWVCSPVERAGPEPPGPGLVEEQPPDDGKVATVDPLIGLLGMQVLERISFLLRSPAASSATTPLLAILQAYIRAGADAARAVWQCPGMLKALQGLLQGPADSLPAAKADNMPATALSIVRLLASSCPQLLNSIASSGLLAYAQRALAVPPASSITSVDDQLQHLSLQVEALHVWRICAEHDQPFMHLDDAYAAICRLFSSPASWPDTSGHTDDSHSNGQHDGHANEHVGNSHGSRAMTNHDHANEHVGVSHGSRAMTNHSHADEHVGKSHDSRATASKAALLRRLSLQGSCQAFLLLGSLVRHATRKPDAAMLSPGSATALVNDALERIQPEVLQMVVVQRAAEATSGEAQLGAIHQAPDMLCSSVAAALNFLEAHVTARQAPGDISTISHALHDSHLLDRHCNEDTSSSLPLLQALLMQCSAPQCSAAHASANHASEAPKGLQDSAPQDSASQQTAPNSLASQSSKAHDSASAGELLLAVLTLSQTLVWHQSLKLELLDRLHKKVIHAVSRQVRARKATQAGLVELQPWTATWLQQQLPQQRLLLHALEHVQVASLTAGEAQQAFHTALSLPAVLPPGSEAAALRALSTAFQTALLGPVVAAACQALLKFKIGGSSLALAAAGLTFEQMQSMHSRAQSQTDDGSKQSMHSRADTADQQQSVQSMHSSQLAEGPSTNENQPEAQQSKHEQHAEQQQAQQGSEDVLYPLEPLPNVATCSQQLLQGYSAAWLGLVPAAPLGATSSSGQTAHASIPLLLQPAGSRLPLPRRFHMLEIANPSSAPSEPHVKPSQPLASIPEDAEGQVQLNHANIEADSAAFSVGCALLLEVGLLEGLTPEDSDDMSSGSKIKQAMELVFSPEAAARAGSDHELWYHPLARWTLAALLHRWYQGQPDLSEISSDDAQKWTEHFTAVSFGDPLFALALAPLLSCYSSSATKVSMLQTLADERCLHLMPPLSLAVLEPTAYQRPSTSQEPPCKPHMNTDLAGLQRMLHEFQQSSLLAKCHATSSLVKDL